MSEPIESEEYNKFEEQLCCHMEGLKLEEIPDNKNLIIDKFRRNVKGKQFIKTEHHNHSSEGHWLENQMGILANSDNAPDLLGYEQKKSSKKITYGDWAASQYLFQKPKEKSYLGTKTVKQLRDMCSKRDLNKNGKKLDLINRLINYDKTLDIKYPILEFQGNMTKKEFLKTFGSPNPKKNNRYSWSGSCFPKYGEGWNKCGQRIIFTDNKDLVIEYSYEHDERAEKINFQSFLKTSTPIKIAFWPNLKIVDHINNKFNVNGFYICKKNKDGVYDKICFGKRIDFDYFYNGIVNKTIILDSGMYDGNNRHYSHFRSPNGVWEDLITEEYS